MIDPAGLAALATLANLPALAAQLLADFSAALVAAGAEDVPVAAYRAPGSNLAWDGEQLAVVLVGVYRGQPGQPVGLVEPTAMLTQFATFDLVLIREVPALDDSQPGGVPAPDVIDAAAEVTMADQAAMWHAGAALMATYQSAAGRNFTVEQVTSVGPFGGLAGSALRVSLVVL